MIDKKLQAELRVKFNPDGSDLRRAQLRMVEMLKSIDFLCRKYKLRYWLDSGTLLGAIRHGGFIPWDDDVDICMPQKDLKKLEKIMLTSNPFEDLVLQNFTTDSNFFGFWPVIRDLKSEYIQDNNLHNIRKYKGLQIDIFPLSCKIWLPLFRIIKRIHNHLINVNLYNNNSNLIKYYYYLIKYILIPSAKLISIPITKPYYNMTYGCYFESKRYKANIYPLKEVEFEGYTFYVPQNYDKYLKDIYQDWKEIPSIDNIRTHNVTVRFY